MVTFLPVDVGKTKDPLPGSGGLTDADGRYTLKIIGTEAAGASGAVVGKHEVRVIHHVERDMFDDGPPKTKPTIENPAKYSHKAAFTFEVISGGSSKADFDLKIP